MTARPSAPALVVATLAAVLAAPARAQDDPRFDDTRFDLGLRAVLTGGNGEPANDVPGGGAFGRWRLNDRWSLGLALDQASFDVEEPAGILGLAQLPEEQLSPIDVKAEATTVSAWAQRDYGREGGRASWFWGLGLGISTLDVPDATGPLLGGGTFDIRIEADTELLASASAGWRRELGRRWMLELAARADQHFADWTLTDRVSGRTATIDDWLAWGGHLGIGARF